MCGKLSVLKFDTDVKLYLALTATVYHFNSKIKLSLTIREIPDLLGIL